jgi:ABC-type multidrug transport system permease subunit
VSHPTTPGEEVPLRELFARVINDGKDYLRAELALVKTTFSARTRLVLPALGFFIVALVLLQTGLTMLAVALGALLAIWLGWAGGFAVSALLVLAGTALLVWLGAKRMMKAFR